MLKTRVVRFMAIRKDANSCIKRGIHVSQRFSLAMRLKSMRRAGRCDGKHGLKIFDAE